MDPPRSKSDYKEQEGSYSGPLNFLSYHYYGVGGPPKVCKGNGQVMGLGLKASRL